MSFEFPNCLVQFVADAGDIYHSSDTLGIVTKRMALGRIPFCFPPRKLSGATGSFEAGSKDAS